MVNGTFMVNRALPSTKRAREYPIREFGRQGRFQTNGRAFPNFSSAGAGPRPDDIVARQPAAA